MSQRLKIIIILSAFYLAIYFLYLDRVPVTWVDESWEANAGYVVAQGHLPGYSIMPDRPDGRLLLQPRVSCTLLLASIFKIFGLGLVQGRSVSVLCGLITLIFTFLLAELFFDKKTAILGWIFLMFSTTFFIVSRTIRHDILGGAVAVLAIYFLSAGLMKNNKNKIRLGGLFIGIGLWTHQIDYGLIVLPVILFAIIKRQNMLRDRDFWLCVMYFFCGLLPYIIYVFTFGNYSMLLAQLSDGQPVINGLSGFLTSASSEVSRWSNWLRFPARIFIVVSVLLAMIYSLYKKKVGDKVIVSVIALNFIFFLLVIFIKSARYLILFEPLFSILVARMVVELRTSEFAKRISLRNLRIISTASVIIAVLYFANQVAGDVFIYKRSYTNNYYEFIRKVEQYIPKGARVWGSITFWLGMYKHPYRTQYTYGKDIGTFKPQYVILYDNDIWGSTTSTTGRDINSSKWIPLRIKMENLCEERGTIVGKVKDKFYGDVEIYKINWR